MIGYLRGRLVRLEEPDHAIVDVHGTGYRVAMTRRQLAGLRAGEDVICHVATHVREDAIQLYGFSSPEQLQIFNHLVGISGVGPRLAMNLLSTLTPTELRHAVLTEDRAMLRRVSGVGPKTASRLLLELADRLDMLADPDLPAGAGPAAPPAGAREEARAALLQLGYSIEEAERALRTVLAGNGQDAGDGAEASPEAILRRALSWLDHS